MRTIQRRWNWTGYKEKVLALDPIFYLPLDDLTTTAVDASRHYNNGTHIGVTTNQPGIGDNRLSVYYDGVNDWTECYSAALDALFDPDEITVSIWVRMDAAGWIDGAAHGFFFWAGHTANGQDQIFLEKTTANNQLLIGHKGQGTARQRAINGITTTDWFHLALTATVSGAEVRAFMNGVQQGATIANPVAWTQHLAANLTAVGAINGFGPNSPQEGHLAHCAVWDHVLTPNQVAQLAVIT